MRDVIRRVAVAGVLLGTAAAPAAADMTVYYRAGSWDAFSGLNEDKKPVCGAGTTNPIDGRSFSMRYELGADVATLQAKKPSWNIPAGTQISVVMQIGLSAPWTVNGIGYGQVVEWSMDRNAMQPFDQQFRRAGSMTMTFPGGNEQPWTVNLSGSTAISNAFGRCVNEMVQRAGLTAPASPQQAPTQPYSSQQPAPQDTSQSPPAQQDTSPAPAQPTQPTQPAR